MSEVRLTVRTFRMDGPKQAALKPLEEAAEVFGAFQQYEACASTENKCYDCETTNTCVLKIALANEIADCIQACVNLADRYGIDLPAAMDHCEERNHLRGRYEDEQP